MAAETERDAVTGRETTGHEWDGIKELNNPLPTWWLYTFYASIVFAIVWSVLYPSLPWLDGVLGHSERRSIVATMNKAAAEQRPYVDRILKTSLDEIRVDPDLLTFARTGGRIAFNNNCVPCHQAGGAGTRGYPSLADDDWLWGGTLAEIEQTIRFGIRTEHDKTHSSMMPRFGADSMLTSAQIDDVVEYVRSLSKSPHDAARAARGAGVYAENCVACHMEGGAGNREIGAPALNDAIWLYGGDRAAIRTSVFMARSGVMPAWQDRLDDATIKMLTLYVHGLGGGK
ncbi:cytochrome-c oxidase, cbb3-type subunit III [Vineibacter terrae]|uniref:Cbb3-type cytochrome c oxidase subunit n=1 Tax=Vineibacter terrae TaxID=2586908 RepID=A0A5C8PEQ7_9HYPH|nr:cytochrome-c oxidase, cbb3-type subunit III [Vineibacter terrae]TXL71823.1 cytochrome-c oxidase, cbb3-type subunit III [Vineibacter terrae]